MIKIEFLKKIKQSRTDISYLSKSRFYNRKTYSTFLGNLKLIELNK